MKADTKEFTRKLKLQERFADCDFEDESLVKHRSNFNVKCDEPELAKIIENIERTDPAPMIHVDNLTLLERTAIKELSEMSDIIIKKADKGNTLVVMDTEYYRDKLILNDHLYTETYRQVDVDVDKRCVLYLKGLMDRYRDSITDKEYKYFTSFDWWTSNFIGLPKIHQCKSITDKLSNSNSRYIHMSTLDGLKAQPVVARPVSPTQYLSEL